MRSTRHKIERQDGRRLLYSIGGRVSAFSGDEPAHIALPVGVSRQQADSVTLFPGWPVFGGPWARGKSDVLPFIATSPGPVCVTETPSHTLDVQFARNCR